MNDYLLAVFFAAFLIGVIAVAAIVVEIFL
jgi:hypothetical protein